LIKVAGSAQPRLRSRSAGKGRRAGGTDPEDRRTAGQRPEAACAMDRSSARPRFLWSILPRHVPLHRSCIWGGIAAEAAARYIGFRACAGDSAGKTGPFENLAGRRPGSARGRVGEARTSSAGRGPWPKAPAAGLGAAGTGGQGRAACTRRRGSWRSGARGRFEPRTNLAVYAKQLFRAPLTGEGIANRPRQPARRSFADESCRLWSFEQQHVGQVLIFSIRPPRCTWLGPGVVAGLLRRAPRSLAEASARPAGDLVAWASRFSGRSGSEGECCRCS